MNIAKFVCVAVVASLLVCVGLIAGGATGLGKKVTANGVTARETWDAQSGLSFYNSSTNDVFFLPNVTTNEFNLRYASNTTHIAAPGATLNLKADDNRGISSVCYRSVTNDSVVYINVF